MQQKRVLAGLALVLVCAGVMRAEDDTDAQAVSPVAAAVAATPVARRNSGDLQDSVSDLQDKVQKLVDESDDQKAALESLNREIADLKAQGNSGKPSDANDLPTFWNRLKLHVNTAIRYESQYMGQPAANGLLGNGNSPDVVYPSAPNGASGMYFKHMDLHFNYKLDDDVKAVLHYNLSAVEIDKAGVEFKNLPFPPFTHGLPGLDYTLFIGQMRQHFGVEQQLDSENTFFTNRAMMYGGHTPWHNALNNSRDAFNFDGLSALGLNNLIAELVYDKTMGLHIYHENDLGFLSYSFGFDFVNDETEGSFDGGGTDSLKLGFPLQLTDQDFSEIGRFGLEPKVPEPLAALGPADRLRLLGLPRLGEPGLLRHPGRRPVLVGHRGRGRHLAQQPRYLDRSGRVGGPQPVWPRLHRLGLQLDQAGRLWRRDRPGRGLVCDGRIAALAHHRSQRAQGGAAGALRHLLLPGHAGLGAIGPLHGLLQRGDRRPEIQLPVQQPHLDQLHHLRHEQ